MFTSPHPLSALLFAAGVYAQFVFPDCTNGPLKNETICDSSASPVARAKSLVALYTLEEKINATASSSPGVARLGIPPYQWWNEGLHGIAGPFTNFSKQGGAWSYSTSFPQPILMGASFDDDLITQVAKVISTEARAFNNANRTGLDFWTPNINPFRDPRWGRGQETPGEDTYHLSSYVKALIHGLQGDASDPYKRVVATCKHYAGYDIENWNGNLRYQNDVQISQQDLVEYYLAPSEACVSANVGAFMCSYNAVNGVPPCADPYMLQTVLREHWGWTNEEQWVTSDCDSIQNVFLPHQWSSSREGAAADSLNAGTDLDCGTYMQVHLPGAFKQNLTNDAAIDKALVRQYSSLVRLGYFDAPEKQPYRQLGFDAVATNASQALALKAATEGIVLLKNDGILPLSFGSKKVGLFGEWANATTQMLGNYHGVPVFTHSPLYALQQLGVTVNYAGGRPGGHGDPTTGGWLPLSNAIANSDMFVWVGGMDNGVEAEDHDRSYLTFTGAQLDVIGQLADTGKPVIVVVTGGGQMDTSPLIKNPNISAVLWAGYPGQDGGTAIMDIITGKSAPAGRLPQTQYPSKYVAEVPMTDMTLRPSEHNPGRTYKWYSGKPIFEFGHGLHYTNFSAQIATKMQQSYAISDLVKGCNATGGFLERCPFTSVDVSVKNDGKVSSDYVTLGYLAGSFGPKPYPKKSLVSYKRLFNIAGGSSSTAKLNLTLASLARVDESGNKVLYPGEYSLLIDNQPLTSINFTLTGDEAMLTKWPQPPANRTGQGVAYFNDYWYGGN